MPGRAGSEERRDTAASADGSLEASGFGVTRVVEDSFQMCFLGGSGFPMHWFIRVGFLEVWRTVVDPYDEGEVFGELRAPLNRLAGRQGGLSLTIPMFYVESRRF